MLGLNKIKNIRDLIEFAAHELKRSRVFFGHGTDNAFDEAAYLVLFFFGVKPQLTEKILARKVTADKVKQFLPLLNRRIKDRIPVAYLTNEAYFAGFKFYVDERVLIPRSPIAELILQQFFPWIDLKNVKRILEIGTGSGCIAISCAHLFPKAKIDALDIDLDALEVAKVNCSKHKVKNRVNLLKSDLFQALGNKRYDLIIANPPYVGRLEMGSLPKEYTCEPRRALMAGKRGDEIITRIIDNSSKHLTKHGILIVEVGNSKPLVLKRYPKLPFVWLDFANGESEVLLITSEQLVMYKSE